MPAACSRSTLSASCSRRPISVTPALAALARSPETGYYYGVQMFGRPRSAAVEVRVSNDSDATVRYRIGERTFPLPPRYTRTHQRCRVEDLAFLWEDGSAQEPKTVHPRNGDHFTVDGRAGSLQVRKE